MTCLVKSCCGFPFLPQARRFDEAKHSLESHACGLWALVHLVLTGETLFLLKSQQVLVFVGELPESSVWVHFTSISVKQSKLLLQIDLPDLAKIAAQTEQSVLQLEDIEQKSKWVDTWALRMAHSCPRYWGLRYLINLTIIIHSREWVETMYGFLWWTRGSTSREQQRFWCGQQGTPMDL